ncbi:MAG: DUF2442 domain-containing protein [Candidatus Paraimprobicoccus trichonymphae]|uniref:DUF2442 domain-containing protein n=1 Tax=Candidatus Paraimprobicoccus trichonymphae TaxID=3033793 RepID=A0AA48I3N1_9FIRM|nr:MAG: DUF2442 domain-containing protein [Candidatus Paraimprobicoccus trichonymphae]
MSVYYNEKIKDYVVHVPGMVKVINVVPANNYELMLTFSTGEKKIYDMKPQLDDWYYEPLKNIGFFKTAHIGCGTVVWNENLDLCPEDLYDNSKLIANS